MAVRNRYFRHVPDPTDEWEEVTRSEYQEILLARMAGGDLYANSERMKIRMFDKWLDRWREKPLYDNNDKQEK